MSSPADKRSLHRINNKLGTELSILLIHGEESKKGSIVDYNSLGVLVKLDTSAEIKSLDGLKIFYGSELVCEISSPTIIRSNGDQIVISLKAPKTENKVSREIRVSLPFISQGSAIGLDPFSINQSLIFKITEVSEKGFKIISSKSNRHLTPGLKLENFDFIIPGYGLYKLSFQIKNVSEENNFLTFGCSIIDAPDSFKKDFRKLLLLNKQPYIHDLDGIDINLKKEIKGIRKFTDNIVIRTIVTDDEYEKVLKLRFKAYKEADKVKKDQTWQDMRDEYDEHSVIYAAFAGRSLAGTIRFVYRTNTQTLPFEEYLDSSEIEKFDQRSAVELSRFAVDPHFQGTDIFISLFQKVIFEIAAKGVRSPVCMATKKLSPYYLGIGAQKISHPIPHPTISGETLTLLLFNPKRVFEGKMSFFGWQFVARPAVRKLLRFKLINRPRTTIKKYLLIPFELFGFMKKKLFK